MALAVPSANAGDKFLARDEADLYQRGRDAVSLLWRKWRDRPQIDDPRDERFASGALDEIIDRLSHSSDIDKEIREFSEAAAEQVTTPGRTIFEILQNADDLGATRLKLGLRRRNKADLLAVHNGKPVEVADVIAMTLAFLSLKRQDSKAKGRFGIGLKTLNQIGSRLSVHCPPYHFAVERGSLSKIVAEPLIKGVYDATGDETLLKVTLDREYDAENVEAWARGIDASHLLFLDTLHELSLVDTRSSEVLHAAQLQADRTQSVDLELRAGFRVQGESTKFIDARKRSRGWTRYSADYPVPQDQQRAHKATGQVTPLAIAISEKSERGFLSAGLPLELDYSLPISLNAQFDPDLSRRGIRQKSWNQWLFHRLAELASAVALQRFQTAPRTGWCAVPLHSENQTGSDWTNNCISELTDAIQGRILSRVQIQAGTEAVRLENVSYMAEDAASLLGEEDQRHLAPEYVPLSSAACDSAGRWRRVLKETGAGTELGIVEALELLKLSDKDLGLREPRWFVALASAALAAGLSEELASERSIVCEDGTRESPEGDVLLVKNPDEASISSHLGLQKRLAPIYFSDASPERVQAWIKRYCATASDGNSVQVLNVLARRQGRPPLPLDDRGLLMLREALLSIDAATRSSLAPAIGKAIFVDGYEFRKGRKVATKVTPASAYLPTLIAKDTAGWGAAAKTTEDLLWIDPKYGQILRTARGGELGARRLFLMLGARAGPRIVRQGLDTELALFDEVPTAQYDALLSLSPRATHLQGDTHSPDLDKVISNIVQQRVDDKRRARSRALFETLQRDWDDHLSEYADATARYFYYTWRTAGQVPATWLAEAASQPWLSSKTKRKIAPLEAAIETTTTRLTRGTKASKFVYELAESDSSHPLIAALGVQGTPPASELLAELTAIRQRHSQTATANDVVPLYAALAALIGSERSTDVGDVSANDLRRKFETQQLLLTPLGWKGPSSVYRGRPIFGSLRAIVPEARQLNRLWQLLQIAEAGVAECVDVLEEIACEGSALTGELTGILVDVLRRLAELDSMLSKQVVRQLQRLPLWTTRGWYTKRPVYAVSDSGLQQSLGDDLPLWRIACSIRSLGKLPSHLGVVTLSDSDFSVLPGADVEEADDYTAATFRAAIAQLRSQMGKKSQDLWSAVDWTSLQNVRLCRAPALQAQAILNGRRYAVSRTLHLDGKTTLYFAEPDELGSPEVGERILGPFITGPVPPMIDLAWSYAWRKAEDEGIPLDELSLATASQELDDPLQKLGAKGCQVAGKRLFGHVGAEHADKRGKKKLPHPPKPRRLKDFANAAIRSVTVIEGEGATAKVKHPKLALKREPWKLKGQKQPQQEIQRTPLKEWNERERELQGFELLAGVLKQIDDLQLNDFSALRGIGADSIDDLKRYFELKVFAGDAPDEVRFEPSEFERALQARSDYFLAVISGLEEGYDTQIKIFVDPVRTLPIRRVSQIRLGGIKAPNSSRLVINIGTTTAA